MMRVLVLDSRPGSEWSRQIFPDLNPAELPMAGKPWVLHVADLSHHLEAERLTFVDSAFSPDMQVRLGNGSYWSLRLDCTQTAGRSFSEMLAGEREGMTEDDKLLVIRGRILPDVPKPHIIFNILRPVRQGWEDAGDLPDGLYLLREGNLWECICPLFRLSSIKDYFDSNFRLMNVPGFYSLPGYAEKDGICFGANVVIMPTCDMKPPAIIMNNCYFGAGTVLNDVIIGSGVAVDAGTEIEHSIIMDCTYIGKHMLLKNKIVRGGRVVEPYSGNWLDLDDSALAGDFADNPPGIGYRLSERLIAAVCALFEWPFWLLALCLRKMRLESPFVDFLLQIYPKFWKVIVGKCHLVRYRANCRNFVFHFADMWYPNYQNPREQDVTDAYFFHHCSLFLVLAIVIFSQLKRIPNSKVPDDAGNNNGNGAAS